MIVSIKIIYIIKVGLKHGGYAKWQHQICKKFIKFLDF